MKSAAHVPKNGSRHPTAIPVHHPPRTIARESWGRSVSRRPDSQLTDRPSTCFALPFAHIHGSRPVGRSVEQGRNPAPRERRATPFESLWVDRCSAGRDRPRRGRQDFRFRGFHGNLDGAMTAPTPLRPRNWRAGIREQSSPPWEVRVIERGTRRPRFNRQTRRKAPALPRQSNDCVLSRRGRRSTPSRLTCITGWRNFA